MDASIFSGPGLKNILFVEYNFSSSSLTRNKHSKSIVKALLIDQTS